MKFNTHGPSGLIAGKPRSRRRAKVAIVQLVGSVASPHLNLASQRQGGNRVAVVAPLHIIIPFVYLYMNNNRNGCHHCHPHMARKDLGVGPPQAALS
jgi:hypothetical protein